MHRQRRRARRGETRKERRSLLALVVNELHEYGLAGERMYLGRPRFPGERTISEVNPANGWMNIPGELRERYFAFRLVQSGRVPV